MDTFPKGLYKACMGRLRWWFMGNRSLSVGSTAWAPTFLTAVFDAEVVTYFGVSGDRGP